MKVKDFILALKLFIVLVVAFGSFALYRALHVDPIQDAVYSDIYGVSEEVHQ